MTQKQIGAETSAVRRYALVVLLLAGAVGLAIALERMGIERAFGSWSSTAGDSELLWKRSETVPLYSLDPWAPAVNLGDGSQAIDSPGDQRDREKRPRVIDFVDYAPPQIDERYRPLLPFRPATNPQTAYRPSSTDEQRLAPVRPRSENPSDSTFRQHVVGYGETWKDIAELYLSSPEHESRLRQLNSDWLSTRDQPPPGAIVRVPVR